MTTAQQLADLAQQDFGAAIRSAVQQGHKAAVWFAGCEYRFADGSVMVMRAGRVESPSPAAIVWTAEKRVEYDV